MCHGRAHHQFLRIDRRSGGGHLGRLAGARRQFAARHPAGRGAGQQQRDTGGDGGAARQPLPPPPGQRIGDRRRQLFIEHAVVQRMQAGVLRPVAGHPARRLGVLRQPCLDLGLARRVELAIDQRVQFAIVDPPVVHLTLRIC